MITGARTGDIRKYAELTGGPVLDTSKKEIAARLAELVDQIRLRYTIGYKPTTPKSQGGYRQVKVDARSHDHGKLTVRTKSGYYAGAEPASGAQ